MTVAPQVEVVAQKYPEVADEVRKLNPRQVAFAQCYAAEGNATECYQRAYGTEDRHQCGINGANLLKHHRVNALIQAISHRATAAAARRIEFTKEKIMLDLEAIKEKGMEINQLGPTVRATELQGKELGMFVDRSEQIRRVADADLVEQLAALSPEMALLAHQVLDGEATENKMLGGMLGGDSDDGDKGSENK